MLTGDIGVNTRSPKLQVLRLRLCLLGPSTLTAFLGMIAETDFSQVATIDLDIGRNTFHLVVLDKRGAIVGMVLAR